MANATNYAKWVKVTFFPVKANTYLKIMDIVFFRAFNTIISIT